MKKVFVEINKDKEEERKFLIDLTFEDLSKREKLLEFLKGKKLKEENIEEVSFLGEEVLLKINLLNIRNPFEDLYIRVKKSFNVVKGKKVKNLFYKEEEVSIFRYFEVFNPKEEFSFEERKFFIDKEEPYLFVDLENIEYYYRES